jgi:hypothetical protein
LPYLIKYKLLVSYVVKLGAFGANGCKPRQPCSASATNSYFLGELMGRFGDFFGANGICGTKKPDFSGFIVGTLLVLVDSYTSILR